MRIEQQQNFMMDMIRQVARGDLTPAAFQRPYVWGPEDVEAMFESILEGWPIGSFVLWSPYGAYDVSRIARGRLGPILTGGDRLTGVILDGQNRLASLAWAMADLFPEYSTPDDLSISEAATWTCGQKLVADYSVRRIMFVPREEAETDLRIPVSVICDSTALNKHFRRHDVWDRIGSNDAALKWVDDCAHAMRSARVTTTNLNGATPAEAKRAFLKICRVGVPMSAEDFEAALGWAEDMENEKGMQP